MNIFVFLLIIIIVIRTLLYGFWTLKGKNITGGIFVILLSSLTAGYVAYLMFRGGT